jgi:hypothetical protein
MIEYAICTASCLAFGAWLRRGFSTWTSYTPVQLKADMRLLETALRETTYESYEHKKAFDISIDTICRWPFSFIPKYGLTPKEREFLQSILDDKETEKILREEGIA